MTKIQSLQDSPNYHSRRLFLPVHAAMARQLLQNSNPAWQENPSPTPGYPLTIRMCRNLRWIIIITAHPLLLLLLQCGEGAAKNGNSEQRAHNATKVKDSGNQRYCECRGGSLVSPRLQQVSKCHWPISRYIASRAHVLCVCLYTS